MKKTFWTMALVLFGTGAMMAQESDPLATGLGGVATVVGETQAPEVVQDGAATQTSQDGVTADSMAAQDSVALKPIPTWKKKL
ncbi:MAG: hypothetical protein II588_05780, partial [Paludibacteraceae bacterium]|nr:hypothetical protein [Paludibacteraceae bacterium]